LTGVATLGNLAHIGLMAKSNHIVFEPQRIADDDWQIRAHCPGARIEYITGFKSEDKAREWIASGHSLSWARSWGEQND
jgi:hypothetical protein